MSVQCRWDMFDALISMEQVLAGDGRHGHHAGQDHSIPRRRSFVLALECTRHVGRGGTVSLYPCIPGPPTPEAPGPARPLSHSVLVTVQHAVALWALYRSGLVSTCMRPTATLPNAPLAPQGLPDHCHIPTLTAIQNKAIPVVANPDAAPQVTRLPS